MSLGRGWVLTAGILAGMVISHPPWYHKPEPKIVTKTVTKTVTVTPSPTPVPGPTVYVSQTPEACVTLADGLDQLLKSVQTVEPLTGQVADMLSTADEDIARHDIQALTRDIQLALDLHNEIGTASVHQYELVDKLTSALKQCRQETKS